MPYQGRSYIYTQKCMCIHILTKNMENLLHLDLRVQNVCVEAILISLNPNLTEFVLGDIVIGTL